MSERKKPTDFLSKSLKKIRGSSRFAINCLYIKDTVDQDCDDNIVIASVSTFLGAAAIVGVAGFYAGMDYLIGGKADGFTHTAKYIVENGVDIILYSPLVGLNLGLAYSIRQQLKAAKNPIKPI